MSPHAKMQWYLQHVRLDFILICRITPGFQFFTPIQSVHSFILPMDFKALDWCKQNGGNTLPPIQIQSIPHAYFRENSSESKWLKTTVQTNSVFPQIKPSTGTILWDEVCKQIHWDSSLKYMVPVYLILLLWLKLQNTGNISSVLMSALRRHLRGRLQRGLWGTFGKI